MQITAHEDRVHHADPVDRASHEEQLALDAAIKTALNKREPALKAVGTCYNCGEVFGDDEQSLRFCDEDCRDDYEHRMTRRRVNGTLQ
jgi:RNA polymerase-binding transcription factor DksA